MKSPVITLAELNTVYKDLIDRINVASVYNFMGEITITNVINTPNDVSVGDIYEIHNISTDEKDIADILNLQNHDNIACKKPITKGTKLSLNPDEDNYWGNYWTEVGSYMQLADSSHNGFVSIGTQEFKGDKTFLDTVKVTKTLTVEGGGTVSTSTLNITGGESDTKALTTDKLNVSGTTTVKNLYGDGTTLTVKSGGTTTVNTIDGIDNDYADFKVSGTVTCSDFTATDQTIVANIEESKISNINSTSAILNASRIISCTDFTATNQTITADIAESIISNIDNTSAVLKASGIVSCVNFDASGYNIEAQKATSVIKNINTETGVLYVGDSIKCKTFDATGQTITVDKDTSILKNISSTTATLNGVSSITCGSLNLGNYGLTVNDTTTFSSISNKTGSSSPSLTTSGIITCGDVNLVGTDNTTYKLLTVNNEVTLSSISGNSTAPVLKTSGNITCGDFNNGSYGINTSNDLTFNKTITSSTTELKSSGIITCKNFNATGSDITSTTTGQTISFSTVNNADTLSASGTIICKDFDNTTGTIKDTNTSDTIFSNITGSGVLDVSGTLYCGNLYASSGSGTVRVPTVNLGDGTTTIPISYSEANPSLSDSSHVNELGYSKYVSIGDGTDTSRGDLNVNGHIFASKVHNAVWNDLVDCIPVDEDCNLEYGYCYSFDGEKYHKSNKHCDSQFIGIHSDTSGIRMGERPYKTLDAAISGFVLAYVDHYKSGTPLVCGKNGRLEKATVFDKIFKPYRIIATYWKDETEEEYGPKSSKVKVNGRNWVKIR